MKEHPAFWQSALQQLQSMTTPEMFKSWLLPLEIQSVEETSLTFKVPTPFFNTFLKSNFEAKIVNALAMTTGKTFKISYTLAGAEPTAPPASASVTPLLPNIPAPGAAKNDADDLPSRNVLDFSSRPDPSYPNRQPTVTLPPAGAKLQKGLIKCTSGYVDTLHTFEGFIVSSGTQFAHAAAKAAGNFPGGKYNPLLIYGPSGLGKTHLLHAIAIQMLRNNPQARICYLSAEQFVNEFIEAVKNKSTNHFHSRYRTGFDAFLIDDIQYLGGKEKSEEEFFHTFNHLFGTHNQVVLTSDKPP
ncbi:MAG: AAA family ATPase, partial [Proteobacteria bacterium]